MNSTGEMKRIVIFASGAGSNARQIIHHFQKSNLAKVEAVFCNNAKAGVIQIANQSKIDLKLISRQQFFETEEVLTELKKIKPDLIVLAGFMWLVPQNILDAFTGCVINIHPSLLPNYGGAGMFGKRVHATVIANHEVESGVTIHEVNENFDDGKILFQAKLKLNENETADSLEKKINQLELKHFSSVIETLLMSKMQSA